MSQRQLAFDGCTPAYISRLEAGMRIPSLQLLVELGERLGVSAEYLARGCSSRSAASILTEAEAATRLDELAQAEELYETLLAGQPSDAQAAAARVGLAEIASRRSDHARTVELLEPVLWSDPTPETAAWAADRLGRAYALLGEYESALAVFERALSQAQESGDELGVLRFSTLLANALLDSGNVGRAEGFLAQAIEVADRAQDPVDIARVWWSQSRLHIQLSHPETAARYVRKAADLLEATEHVGFAAAAFQLIARIENDRGNGADALELLERGRRSVTASGNRYYEALFALERARALAHVGDAADAGSAAMHATALLEEASPADAGRGYAVLADVYRKLDDTERALELYELASERLADDDPYQAEIDTALGGLLETEGRLDEALAAYKRAAQRQAGLRAGRAG